LVRSSHCSFLVAVDDLISRRHVVVVPVPADPFLLAVFVGADADEQRLVLVDETHQYPRHEAATADELVSPDLAHVGEVATGLDAVANVGQHRSSAMLSHVLDPVDHLGSDRSTLTPGSEVSQGRNSGCSTTAGMKTEYHS